MEKRIKATKIEVVRVKSKSDNDTADLVSGNRASRIPSFQEDRYGTPFVPDEDSSHRNGPVTDREKNVAFGLGLLACVIGVILTPILIGIPVLGVGLWMVLFPISFVKYSRRK